MSNKTMLITNSKIVVLDKDGLKTLSLWRNKLTMKEADMISSSRMSNTGNPFIIYNFYDTLEKVSCQYSVLKSG